MSSKQKNEQNEPLCVELKYCEHCGGLWVRERGAGVVYCDNCRLQVAELPAPRKKQGRVTLPVRPHTAVENYEFDDDDGEANEFEAAGGVA